MHRLYGRRFLQLATYFYKDLSELRSMFLIEMFYRSHEKNSRRDHCVRSSNLVRDLARRFSVPRRSFADWFLRFFRNLRYFVKPRGLVKIASNMGAVGVRFSYIMGSLD